MTTAEQFIDEIYGLHCDIGRLEVENARLRQQLADAIESNGRLEMKCAELRKLAEDWKSRYICLNS